MNKPRWVIAVFVGLALSGTLSSQEGQVSAPGPTSATPPLKLPSTYINVHAQTDRLKLNADHTFSLQEAGQSSHGTFVVNGDTLELSIVETNTKAAATIQGNGIIDGSGQTWVLEGQPAGTERSVPAAPETSLSMTCPDYAACLTSGSASLSAGQWDQSLTDLQRASTLEPGKPEAWAKLGHVYLASGQYSEAAAMWDKALSLGGSLTFGAWLQRGFH
jgi:tetratricopeptide (TPR) repeat protein